MVPYVPKCLYRAGDEQNGHIQVATVITFYQPCLTHGSYWYESRSHQIPIGIYLASVVTDKLKSCRTKTSLRLGANRD